MTEPVSRAAVSSLTHRADIAAARLWTGILAAPTAWVAQGGLGWYVGERVCTSMSVPAGRMVLGVVSLLAVAAAAAGLLVAWQNWQRSADDRRSLDAWDRVAFMSMAGMLVSASFVMGTIWAGLGPLLIDTCGGMR